MKCTYVLNLSSEAYDKNVELFLPKKKAILTSHSAVDSHGTSDTVGSPKLSVFRLILLSF